MPNFRLALAASLALSLGAASADAQQSATTPSTPFHAGQWALQGDLNGQFALGLLRFASPTRALLLTVGGSASRRTTEYPSSAPVQDLEQRTWAGSAQASAGVRNYRPVTSVVAVFNTIGLGGTYQRFFDGHTLGGGPFVDLGGQYLLGERFSFGVSSGLSLNYSKTNFGPSSLSPSDDALTVNVGNTRVSATVYF